jgi:protein-S-isoprenylcysteine O-methyltransferase Ste14
MSAGQHAKAIGALPFVVLVLVPSALLFAPGVRGFGWGLEMPLLLGPIIGAAVAIFIGLWLMAATITLFATIGQGSLAPWDPTEKLVVAGPYRYVRNPMISGVIFVLAGEVALAGSVYVLGWWLLFLVGNAIYIPVSEEPGLVERFGDAYREYRKNVPRWIPRFRPWSPDR